jgi:hypothetical protein
MEGGPFMSTVSLSRNHLAVRSRAFYRRVLDELSKAKLPFLVGGAFALEHYTGIWRFTKDLDIFMRRQDIQPALRILGRAGFQAQLTYPHWLAKVYERNDFVDVIFSSGNGVATVDDDWFTYANTGTILGASRKICPVEEMIWSKSFVMERERYDGADVAHLILARGPKLDWARVLKRFGPHWEILLSHLVLFGFIYPSMRSHVPDRIIRKLVQNLLESRKKPSSTNHSFKGTLLSREQYLIDLNLWGYPDARLKPNGFMSPKEVALWTEAIGRES